MRCDAMRVAAIVACLLLVGSGASNIRGPSQTDHDAGLKAMVDDLSTNNAGRWKSVAEHCEAHIAVARGFEGVFEKSRVSKDARQQLQSAVNQRVGNLQKYVNKLKTIRRSLYDRIKNVNTLFKAKWDENHHAVQAATLILQHLGHMRTKPFDPSLKPIKNVQLSVREAKSTKSATSPASATGLAEEPVSDTVLIEASTLDSLKGCENGKCAAASQTAFELYELGLSLNEKMIANFEKERAVLAAFREKLKELITKKTTRLSNLISQAQKIEAQLQKAGTPQSDRGQVTTALKSHISTFSPVCNKLKEQREMESQQIQQLKGMLG